MNYVISTKIIITHKYHSLPPPSPINPSFNHLRSMIAWVFAPLGGKVNDVAPDHTAFPHRTSGGNFHMPTIWFAPSLAQKVRDFGQRSLYLTRQWWIPSANSSSSGMSTMRIIFFFDSVF